MKIISSFILGFILCLFCDYAYSDEMIIPLKMIQVLPVEGLEKCEPSGLTIINNTLYTVSDKHDSTIFEFN